jgi:small subunit ribosomal protein S6e
MTFKINIGTKEGKTYHLETEANELLEKKLHDKVEGKDISRDLNGYEFEITGASDKSGFTSMENVEGSGLKKVLLTYGKAMKKKPRKEGKKKLSKNRPKGLRLRKTVRGKVISEAISQINFKILKEGEKKLSEIFSEQNKTAEPEIKKGEKNKEEFAKEVKEEK